MSGPPANSPPGDEKGPRRFATGALFGVAGGIAGLVLPISLNFLAVYNPTDVLTRGPSVVELTTILVLAGAILLAVSFLFYRAGFSTLQKLDRWFYSASVLCILGSIGLMLILLSTVIALATTPSLVQCIQGAPSHTFRCLRTIEPLTAYSVIVGFWLAWLGGLGIVVGIELAGRRYRQPRFVAGGATYALLLLVLIDPFLGLLFPVGGWQYPLLLLPVLAVVAPAFVSSGSRRVLGHRSGG